MKENKLVVVEDLKKHFSVAGGSLKAVDGITFDIYEGETFGLVGESGCGKSTAGRTILRLYEPSGGKVNFNGQNIFELKGNDLREIRKDMQMIFQDPYASLDPRMTVEDIVAEPLDIFNVLKGKDRYDRVVELLELVGLSEEHAQRFPHEFSGGQRQRIGIARALALNPKFIICDEPISALDVSIQAQILDLMQELVESSGIGMVFVTHDLAVISQVAHRIAVMYCREIVEMGEAKTVLSEPVHPYTQGLIAARPEHFDKLKGYQTIEGQVPSLFDLPKGCYFAPRCPFANQKCRTDHPEIKGKEHLVRCHMIK